MLLLILWDAVKNTSDIPLVDLGNHSQKPMKFTQRREIFPGNKCLTVGEGIDVQQCACFDVSRDLVPSKEGNISKSDD